MICTAQIQMYLINFEALPTHTLRECLDTIYFAENWKHCSKIIFKCVNDAIRPIFNESLYEKKRFMGLVNSAQDSLESWNTLLSKEKKKKEPKRKEIINIQTYSKPANSTQLTLVKVLAIVEV